VPSIGWSIRGQILAGDRRRRQGIPPTGKQVTVPGVVFYRIQEGKIAEFRGSFDRLSMLQQLGAVPAASPG
jgi:predicted ester cyclase